MQTSFYASGFLYSPRLNQILLLKSQKKDSTDFLWSTLGGESIDGEDAQTTFARIISKFLDLDLKAKDIYSIYDYFLDEKKKDSYVFYAQVKKPKEYESFNGYTFSWVAFDQIAKLPFTSRSKQDIIVGERVIKAKWREEEAKNVDMTAQVYMPPE